MKVYTTDEIDVKFEAIAERLAALELLTKDLADRLDGVLKIVSDGNKELKNQVTELKKIKVEKRANRSK
jgi:hypothetical protein